MMVTTIDNAIVTNDIEELVPMDLEPLPFTTYGNIILNLMRIRFIEWTGLEPGTARFEQWKKFTDAADKWIENSPGNSGDVVFRTEIDGFMKVDLRKP